MMHKKVLAFMFLIITPLMSLFAQEDDWYWNKTISNIEFKGLINVKKSEINGVTNSFINQPFTEDNYSNIVDRLYSIDFFQDIEINVLPDEKNSDRIILQVNVTEYPVVKSISFKGNRNIRNGELKEQLKIKVSDIYITDRVYIEERNLRNYYLSKGYTNSKVSHSIKELDDGVEIVFEITEGANTVIKEIHFTGNTIISERVLKSKLGLKEVGFMRDGAYQAETLEQDKMVILNYYREHGYIDANIIDVKIDSVLNEEKSRNELTILFVIQEGAQYIFKGLDVSGCEVFSKEELLTLNKLKVGSVYNDIKFQEAIHAIAGKYYENGYMSSEFSPVPTKNSDTHEISYVLYIRESVRSHIENIIIKGNTKTKDYVILREIPIQSGDIFSRDKIINGLRNLMNLQYFSNVVPDTQVGSEPNLVDLVFTVEEQSTTTLNFGASFSGMTDPDTIPISVYTKIENSNLGGEGKSLSGSINFSNTEQSFDFTYGQNWIGKIPLAFQSSMSFAHDNSTTAINMWKPDMDLTQKYYYTKYTGWSVNFSNGLSRRWTPNFAILTLSTGLSNNLTDNIYDESLYVPVDQGTSAYANRIGLMNSVWTSFSIDDRDLNYDPSKGWFASERLAWYGLIPILEKEFFLRSDTKLEGYLTLCNIPFGDKWNLKLVLAEYAGFSALFPVNSTITNSNRLYVDGILNGRGWTNAYKTNKGQVMFSNKLELRMPIVPNYLGLTGFWDAAFVKPTVADISTLSLGDWYFSLGPGLKILMPQFPLHLLFAFKYQYVDNKFTWDDSVFEFVLSFNVINR